jgi:putative transposase
MSRKRRQYNPEYKFKVALEAAKGTKTVSEIAALHEIHPNQVRQWKRQLLDEGGHIFSRNGNGGQPTQETNEAELYEQIGRLKMELEWLKKKATQFS